MEGGTELERAWLLEPHGLEASVKLSELFLMDLISTHSLWRVTNAQLFHLGFSLLELSLHLFWPVVCVQIDQLAFRCLHNTNKS